LAILGVLAPTIYADTFLIDDFSMPIVGQTITVTGTGSQTSTINSLTGVVGNTRTMNINVTSSAYGYSSTLKTSPLAGGTLELGNEGGQNGVGTITWDAGGAGLGGIDITNGGLLPYFQAKMLSSDQTDIFRVDITDSSGHTAYWTSNLGTGPNAINQLLSSFTNPNAADFTSVDKIMVTLSSLNLAQDTVMDTVEVTNTPVPEPATMTLLALGGFSVFMARRRRKV
jgi:hypothetical protein